MALQLTTASVRFIRRTLGLPDLAGTAKKSRAPPILRSYLELSKRVAADVRMT